MVRAELNTACEVAQEFLHLAERLQQPGLAMLGHEAMEMTLMHMGRFTQCVEHFEQALSLYEPEQYRDEGFLYSQNPLVAMSSHVALALWLLGHPDQALERMTEALALAHKLSEPHGLAHTLYFAAILYHLRGQNGLAREHAEAAIVIAREHGLIMYQAFATIAQGWAWVEKGALEKGIEQIRRGIALHQSTGAQVARPHFLALLAEALRRSTQTEAGLQVVEEGLDLSNSRDEGRYLAELYRIKGELLLTQAEGSDLLRDSAKLEDGVKGTPSAVPQAESCFQQSIKIAQQQKAKSWELRAVMSLARLYQTQGRQREARRLLAQIYNSFTEGLETLDLLEAKTLLDELSNRGADIKRRRATVN
jgi:predicted ATPase